MIQLNLYQDEKINDEHIDIYYSKMKPVIQQVMDVVKNDKPEIIALMEKRLFCSWILFIISIL